MWPITLAVVTLLYAFGPGMLLVRWLRLPRTERVVVAVGIGLLFDFLLSFLFFVLRQPQSTHFITSIIAIVLGVCSWKDWRQTLAAHHARRVLIAWCCILAWSLVLLSMIRHFGGGTWSGDWVEQLERTNFFLTVALPDFTPYQTFLQEMKYPVPMRPPMINALTAGILGQAVDEAQVFEAYQLVFLFLNSLVFLPCALLIPRLVKLPPRLVRKSVWTLAAVFAANPMFCQNVSYAWTKLFAAFYAVLAIVVYLRAWRRGRKDEGRRMKDEASISAFSLQPSAFGFPLAFALLCAGFLVHYSVGPYALFLGLHYLIAVWWRRPKKWFEAGLIGGVSLAVLAVWFGWSIAIYGKQTTFGSPSTVSDAAKMTPQENIASIGKNVLNTLVPRIVQRPDLIHDMPLDAMPSDTNPATSEDELTIEDLQQPSDRGRVRDFFFLIYQVSLPGGLGLLGWVFALWLLIQTWRGRLPSDRPMRRFWIACIPTIFIVGVVVYGGRDRFGVAHICLQPLILMGLCLLAGGVWTIHITGRAVFAAGLLLDFAVGVLLQVSLEHHIFPMDVRPQLDAAGKPMFDPTGTPLTTIKPQPTPDVPSRAAQFNLGQKMAAKLEFWGDHFPDALPLQMMLGCGLAGLMAKGLLGPRRRRVFVQPVAARSPSKTRRRTKRS